MSQFNPSQFGGIMSPGAQMQANLANQYGRDQQQMTFQQQQQQMIFGSAQQLMMNKIFGDLEKKRLEREQAKSMIGRIHRAASLLGDYGMTLEGSDQDLGGGKLSDLLKAQQERKGALNAEMAGLTQQARSLEKELALLTDPQG